MVAQPVSGLLNLLSLSMIQEEPGSHIEDPSVVLWTPAFDRVLLGIVTPEDPLLKQSYTSYSAYWRRIN